MKSPNILIFHCHDMGRTAGCYSIPGVKTPNIDKLAADGILFTRNFCTAPQCSPSRASMFTGRYPHNNGVMGLTHSHFAWELNGEERHAASIFTDAGYKTISIGIAHETQRNPEDWGFLERVELREEAATAVLVADHTITALRNWKDNASDQPFFISAGCYEPHRQPSAAEKDAMGFIGDTIRPAPLGDVHVPDYLRDDEPTRKELAELYGAIHHVDGQFGRVMHALRDLDLESDTCVVFTTDHGIAMPRAKCTCYDPGIGIALIVRYTGRPGWSGGSTVDSMVSNIDLLPSLCDLIDTKIPECIQGVSWAPLLDHADGHTREEIYAEMSHHDYYDPTRAIRTDKYKLIAHFSSAPSYMPPNQSWKPRSSPKKPEVPAITYHSGIELYDLDLDPYETHNVIDKDQYRSVSDMLMKKLHRHLVETDDPILKGAITPPLHTKVLNILENASH